MGSIKSKQEVAAINGDRRSLACIAHDDWCISALVEESGEVGESGESWFWVVWNQRKKKMASPSTRSKGKRWGAYHCSKCIALASRTKKVSGLRKRRVERPTVGPWRRTIL
jgi:hypothetical protein